MNDYLENLHYDLEWLKHDKSESEILLDHYTDRLKHITDPEVIKTTTERKEFQENKVKELTKGIAKIAGKILEFWV